ncbi:unnamed protein product [Penicillium camemberti]|uniref:Str. FM013 n=1 Tax=Penicillium camemberti (strain FM 013) TaxID=1429867 RepID=A0A0G4P078_PENC3|nr:unnamed protein product [Penicillium camemberti]
MAFEPTRLGSAIKFVSSQNDDTGVKENVEGLSKVVL